jgi:hypothetical protein
MLWRTVAELENAMEEGGTMEKPKINRPEYLLEGFTSSVYDTEARDQWSEEMKAEEQEMTDRMVRMAEMMVADTPADDPAVLEEVDWYYHLVSRYGTSNAEMFTLLGQLCVEDKQVKALFEKVAEGLAAYQRNAIAAYSRARLS